MQGYAQLVARGEEALKSSAGALKDDEGKTISQAEFEDRLKADHDKMIDLAKYVEERWPRDLAADLARHQIGLMLYRQKKLPEAVQKLSTITPGYPAYAMSQYKLAEIALEAERDKAPPLPGDKPGDYHQRALAALEAVTEPGPDADGAVGHAYFVAKARLGEELFAAKKFADMDRVARPLLPKLAQYHFDADPQRDEAVRQYLRGRLVNVTLYAAYGLADAEFTATHYAKVAALLDPLADEAKAGKLPELGKNTKLGSALLSMALRANVQLGKMDRAQVALQAIEKLAAESGGKDAATDVLRQLGVVIREQMQEVRKKGDEDDVKKVVSGFSTILEGLTKAQTQPSPEFSMLLAQNLSSLGQHDKAVAVLEKIPPAEGEDKAYRTSRLLLVRELRQAKQFDKASPMLDEIIGTKEKPGWGQRNVDALMERVFLLEDAGKYFQAANLASTLVRQLGPKAATDNTLKEKYLETYYHLVRCFYKHARGMDDKTKRAKGVKDAAVLMQRLEKAWENFGGEASKARFQDLLDQEAELKDAYEKIKDK
jgi:tetratricopeptide (TPR) repeat protein